MFIESAFYLRSAAIHPMNKSFLSLICTAQCSSSFQICVWFKSIQPIVSLFITMQNTFRLSKWKRKATENEKIFYCLLSIMVSMPGMIWIESIGNKSRDGKWQSRALVTISNRKLKKKNIIRVCCLRELIKFSRPPPPKWALGTKNHKNNTNTIYFNDE